jgi:membrane protein YdbS with pleckstrin-like domain
VIPEPAERLAPSARRLWRVQGAIPWGIALVVGVAVPLEGTLSLLARVLPLVGLVAAVGIVPEVRWRRWRYEVRPEEIDIRRGLVVMTRTLVPMLRVQHVDTTQGPLERLFGLADVVFHTAAGANRIPALTEGRAGEVRDRIAALTRRADEL